MDGHPRVVALLHRALSHELGAAQHCALQAGQAAQLGLKQLAEELRDSAREELAHAEAFAAQLLAGGRPLRPGSAPVPPVGGSHEELLRRSCELEIAAIRLYEESVRTCDALGEPETSALFARILAEERVHLRAIEAQRNGLGGRNRGG